MKTQTSRHREAMVYLRITISAEGKAERIDLAEGGFYERRFVAAAMNSVRDINFRPATFDGKSMRSTVTRDSQRNAVHTRLMLAKRLDKTVRHFLSGTLAVFIWNGRSRLLVCRPHIPGSTRKTELGCSLREMTSVQSAWLPVSVSAAGRPPKRRSAAPLLSHHAQQRQPLADRQHRDLDARVVVNAAVELLDRLRVL